MMSCSAPALKDLPRVAGDFKSELEGFKTDNLKNADTKEKIVLPTAEDVAAEKTEKADRGNRAFRPNQAQAHRNPREKSSARQRSRTARENSPKLT